MKKKILLFIFTLLVTFSVTSVFAKNNMEVKDLKVIDKSSTITVDEPTLTGDTITSKVQFNEVGDYVIYELTLKNTQSEKYKIEKITDSNSNDNIKLEYEYDDDFVEAGATTKIKIKATYKNQLVNVEKVSLNDVTMTVDLVNENGAKTSTVINPKTGDSIIHYVILGVVALAGIGLAIFGKKIKGSKVGYLMVLGAIAMYPITALAADKFEIKFVLSGIEVKGKFEEYNIVVTDGAGNETTRKITYGQAIGELPEAPKKTGFAFVKYVDQDGNEVTSETIITKPITLEPVYNEVKHTVTFNPNGGTVSIESIQVREGSKPRSLPTPDYNGYVFDGWYTAATGGTAVTLQTTISKDTVVYAHWVESDKLISYEDTDNDDDISTSDIVKLGNDSFVVIGIENGNVQLLPQFNLDSNSRQLEGTDFTVTFSDSLYWGEKSCKTVASGGEDVTICDFINQEYFDKDYDDNFYVYGYNGYRRTEVTVTSNGEEVVVTTGEDDKYGVDFNNLSSYVKNYVYHLADDLGITGIKGARLMTYDEAYSLYLATGQAYWTGTAQEDEVWYVEDDGDLEKAKYDSLSLGIRPIIELDINELGLN